MRQEVRRWKSVWVVVLRGGIQRTQDEGGRGPRQDLTEPKRKPTVVWTREKMHQKCLGTMRENWLETQQLFFLPSFPKDPVIQQEPRLSPAELVREVRGEPLGEGADGAGKVRQNVRRY